MDVPIVGLSNPLPIKASLLGLVLFLMSSSCLSNPVLGQEIMPSVKIVSPSEGEQVNQGNGNLTIRGISSDNSTSNCEVSIILNDIKPYQSTVPIKTKDYSSWSFSPSSSYNPVKEGQNKATAKISCLDMPVNNLKWYSVYFISMHQNGTANGTTNGTGMIALEGSQNQAINKTGNVTTVGGNVTVENRSKSMNQNINVSNAQTTSLNANSNTREKASTQITNLTGPAIPKRLLIDLQIAKNPILTGSLQTANVSVSDSSTRQPIENARVGIIITASSGKMINFEHTTSFDGKTSFSWIVPRIAEVGLSHLKFDVSAEGYESNQTAASYEVIKNSMSEP